MKDILEFVKQISEIITWPVAILLMAWFFRKPLQLTIKAITKRIETAEEIGIGKDGLTMKGLVEKIKATEQKAEDAQKSLNAYIATGGAGNKEVLDELRVKKEQQKTAAFSFKQNDLVKNASDVSNLQKEDLNDPQKNKWGGESKRNNRELKAVITPTPGAIPLYKIQLMVVSTSVFHPLTGKVLFHLHPTFPNHVQEVDVVNGIAELQLISYGSFTVGAEADNGTTMLELDLSVIEGTTEHFKTT